jgi:hypothetical protein
MFKKLNNKKLSVLFIVLLLLVALVIIADNKSGGRSFAEDLTPVDTAKVTKVGIVSGKTQGAIQLEKQEKGWKVVQNGKKYDANPKKVNSILDMLTKMQPSGVVADDKETWGQFDVTDSLGTCLEVFAGKKKVADLVIGRFDFKQSNNPYNQGGSFKTFVRPKKDNKVYTINEFLTMTFSTDISGYRNNQVVNVNPGDIAKASFSYPADSSFVLENINGQWMVNGTVADSASVASYLNGLRNKSHSWFVDDKPEGKPEYMITLEGSNMITPVVISAKRVDEKHIVMSNMNIEAYFDGEKSGLFENLFVAKQHFLVGGEDEGK